MEAPASAAYRKASRQTPASVDLALLNFPKKDHLFSLDPEYVLTFPTEHGNIPNHNNYKYDRKHMRERRSSRRKNADFKVALTEPSCRILTNIKNISSSGIYCQIDNHISVMKKVALDMELSANSNAPKTISCEGVVVRCDRIPDTSPARYDTAIYFTDIPNNVRSDIEDYIKSSNGLDPVR